MVVWRLTVCRALECGVAVVVLTVLVRMRVCSAPGIWHRLRCAVRVRMGVPVAMGVVMPVRVRMAVYEIAMPVKMVVGVLVVVCVLVLVWMLVLDWLRTGSPPTMIVRMVVRLPFPMWHRYPPLQSLLDGIGSVCAPPPIPACDVLLRRL